MKIDKEKVRECFSKYKPQFLVLTPLVLSLSINGGLSFNRYYMKYRRLRTGYGRYVRKTKSNNWLRKHGYRMRRKAR